MNHMCYDDYDYDNVYEDIVWNDNPTLVKNVSQLRHYINCHGYTKKLLNHLGINQETLDEIRDVAFGGIPIQEVISNPSAVIERCASERQSKAEAIAKNNELLHLYYRAKDEFCGIGIRRTKLFLNRVIKLNNDPKATLYRKALEVEHYNIKAKDADYYYQDRVYNLKDKFLQELTELAKSLNVPYGYQTTDNHSASYVVYIKMPDCEQMSWHCPNNWVTELPVFDGEWDGKVNSTLTKLEVAIGRLLTEYPDVKR